MHWKQLDKQTPPTGEVLAKSGCEVMVGHLANDGVCYSGWTTLSNVTHYILVSDLVKLHNELRP